jgi:hypothetical protein
VRRFGGLGLPGGVSEGLGVIGATFHVPAGAAASVCRFYRTVLGCASAHIATLAGAQVCVVPVGAGTQRLRFLEPPPGVASAAGDVVASAAGAAIGPARRHAGDDAYDGHHVCLYLSGDAFVAAYRAAASRSLVYNNPRFPQFTYDTLDDALQHNEFRVKRLTVDPDTESAAEVYELEHELRTLKHPGFAPHAFWLREAAAREAAVEL